MADAIEHRLHDLGAFIRDRRRDARLSLRRLSELAGISNPYLSQIERGLRKPSADILQQLARALHLSAETLYVRAGILDPQDESNLERAILRDTTLTDAQRRALLEVYRSFQRGREDDDEGGSAAPRPA
ncbi:MAG TPA: helix-turn-helix domain-containing protein [Acidimicrobiia bacterium]|nr:helix-turn-helix domain-containing protein [Acidimicrobiia bacterium]